MTPKEKPKSPSVLATESTGGVWSINVDFVGLSKLAANLYSYAPATEDVVRNMNGSIKGIADEAGWSGSAAKKFMEAWDDDTQLAAKLSTFENLTADIIDQLAVSLSWIQKALDDKIAQLNYTIGTGFRGIDGPTAQGVLKKEQMEAFSDANREADKAQKKAADELLALAAGRKGGWSLLKAIDGLQASKNVSNDLKKSLEQAEDPLRKATTPDGNKSTFDTVIDSNTVKGIGGGAVVGGLVGGGIGLIGGPPGAAAGATIGGIAGGAVGGIWGGFEDIF